MVACDNINSLCPKSDYLPAPKDHNLELMQMVWASAQEPPIDWHPVHVQGCQDWKVQDNNRQLSALDCEMDTQAKLFCQHLCSVLPTLETPQMSIHNDGWTVWRGDLKLPSPSWDCLYAAFQDPITQLYWVSVGRHGYLHEQVCP